MLNNIKMQDEGQNHNLLLSDLLNNFLQKIMQLLNAECGSLFLFDPENNELVLDSFYNSGELDLRGLRQRIGEGISGKIVELKKPVLVSNIDTDSRFKRNGFNHYRTRSFISVPLFCNQGLLGILNIADRSTGEPFLEKDLELTQAFCKYVCAMADNLLQSETLEEEKQTLHKQKNELEKYASVGKLAASIVHQINNPLDGVIRYTNILLSQMDNNYITREYLLEAKKGLNRIANITKSLLEFSHQINSNTSGVKKYVNLHGVINESLDVLCDKFNGNIRVYKRYKEQLAQVLDLGLSHICINIIKNSLDAMPAGGTLEITTDITDSAVEIVFQDTGLGIPSEIQKRIFEPFFTTKSIDRGTGLGLAICNEIIGKYEGRIDLKSSLGEGSKFTVLIPKKYLKNA